MATPQDVIARYDELTNWCETSQQKIFHYYSEYIRCRKGCAECCTLSGVNALEATIISRFIRENKLSIPSASSDNHQCPLLQNKICTVYPARPIICRTHGLPVISSQLTDNKIDYCPLNFEDFSTESFKKGYIIDLDQVTENLVRLNLAFCILLGNQELASQRFSLADIAIGAIPEIVDM
jgi:hypothetical protein